MKREQWTTEETQPLPSLRWRLPMGELRTLCHLSYFQLAEAAGVKPRVVYWMEHGSHILKAERKRIRYNGSSITNL